MYAFIYIEESNTAIKPLAFNAKKSDGFNPHLVVNDEVASWRGDGGLKQYEVIELLERNGWKFKRHGANHDIYVKDGQRESVVRHRETDEELAKAIIKRRGLK